MYQRKGSPHWYIYIPDELGRMRSISSHSTNKRMAEKIQTLKRGQFLEKRYGLPTSTPPLLAEYLPKVVAETQHANTFNRYSSSAKQLLRYLGHLRLTQIHSEHVEEFKRRRYKEGVTAATVNRDLAVLRKTMKRAKATKLITSSPFVDGGIQFDDEKSFRRKPHILTHAEEERLLCASPPYLQTLIILIIETGMRAQREALRLEWSDFDFEAPIVTVRSSKSRAGIRSIPLTNRCLRRLLAWKKLSGASPKVFPSSRNSDEHLRHVQKAWQKAKKEAGLEGLWLYNLRHTFATRMLQAHVPDTTIAGALGHSTTSILSTYARPASDHFVRAMGAFEALSDHERSKLTDRSSFGGERIANH